MAASATAVVRLVSSVLALKVAVALAQAPDGRRVFELAEDLAAAFTSIERALDVLVSDAIVVRHERRNSLVESPQAEATVRLAIAFLEPKELLTAISQASHSVEFYGHDVEGDVMVARRFADLNDEAALSRNLALVDEIRDIHVEMMDKAALRDRLAEDDRPRLRAMRMTVRAGSVDRSFPDRTRHGDPSARPLGRLHPSLPRPSQRRLRSLARRYQLRRITAFGSATRADFRPDSDVDIVVDPRPGHRPRIDRDAVVLYEPGR